MSQELKELIVIEPEKALTVFTTDKALDPYLKLVKVEIDKHVPDVSTKKGREAIASLAYKVAQVKSAVDKIGKELKDEQKKIPDLIDAARNYAKDTLQAWQDECRKPLTDWEQREADRIAEHQRKIACIRDALPSDIYILESMPIAIVKEKLDQLGEVTVDKTWEEFEPEARAAHDTVTKALKTLLETKEKRAAEEAELAELRRKSAEREEADRVERLKKEQEERDERLRQEAAEEARLAAEVKAEAERKAEADRAAKERQEAAGREQKLIDDAKQAEQNRIDAEQRIKDMEAKAAQELIDSKAREAKAAQDAIEQRNREQEEARRREEADRAKREANQKHLKKINNEALQAFITGGLTEECAKLAVTLIAKKSIPNVSISY